MLDSPKPSRIDDLDLVRDRAVEASEPHGFGLTASSRSSARPIVGISSRGWMPVGCLDHDLSGVFRNGRLKPRCSSLKFGSFVFRVSFSFQSYQFIWIGKTNLSLAPDYFSFRYSFVCRFKKIIERTLLTLEMLPYKKSCQGIS